MVRKGLGMRRTAAAGEVLFEFAIIADTHLGPTDGISPAPWKTNSLANARAKAVISDINSRKPAFVVHLGDMVHPVPAHPDHTTAAKRFHEIFAALEAPLHLVPGNHDIGDKPAIWNPAPLINEQFLNLYQANFGAQFYAFDHDGIHFVVVNDNLFNTGFPLEEEQWRWLEQALKGHKRTFLFTHYPLYLLNEQEDEHAENIAEPGRSRLLDLVRRNNVEAVFTAHVHNFFYDADAGTEYYVAPSVAAVRHDYAELFSVAPAEEFGRNDLGKVGYFWVEVRSRGHVAHFLRIPGNVEGMPGAAPLLHGKTITNSRLGIDLRYVWAQPLCVPITGALDEFGRKWVRNDYLLAAIWEMGAGWLRVPMEDIASAEARARMLVLRRSGLRFTVFCFEVPSGRLLDILAAAADCYDRLEIVLPGSPTANSLAQVRGVRSTTGKPVYLSKLRTSAEHAQKTGRYAHFIDCGFHLDDIPLINRLGDMRGAVDGLVFRTNVGERPGALASAIRASIPDMGICLSVRMFGPDPASHHGTQEQTAGLVCDALEAAYASAGPFDIVLDTVIDVDRGYFPRCGLLDRRYNHTKVSRALIETHRKLVARQPAS